MGSIYNEIQGVNLPRNAGVRLRGISILAEHHRLDIDYIPHIGVGNDPDPVRCQRMAADWNASAFCIRGQITAITVLNYEHNKVSPLEVIQLS